MKYNLNLVFKLSNFSGAFNVLMDFENQISKAKVSERRVFITYLTTEPFVFRASIPEHSRTTVPRKICS